LLKVSIAYIFILSIFVSLTFARDENEQSIKIGAQAPKFILKDADDNEFNLEKIFEKDKDNPKIIILIIGNHTTRANGNKWARELDKIYKDRNDVVMYMIADLRGLPFFVTESMVKWGTKKENLPITILLDWKGKISEAYKTRKGESNIFIIDNSLKIRHYLFGEYTPKLMNILIQEVKVYVKNDEKSEIRN